MYIAASVLPTSLRMTTEESETAPARSLDPVTFDGIPWQRQHRLRRFFMLLIEDMGNKDTTDCNALLATLEEARRKQNATQNKKRAREEASTQPVFAVTKSRRRES